MTSIGMGIGDTLTAPINHQTISPVYSQHQSRQASRASSFLGYLCNSQDSNEVYDPTQYLPPVQNCNQQHVIETQPQSLPQQTQDCIGYPTNNFPALQSQETKYGFGTMKHSSIYTDPSLVTSQVTPSDSTTYGRNIMQNETPCQYNLSISPRPGAKRHKPCEINHQPRRYDSPTECVDYNPDPYPVEVVPVRSNRNAPAKGKIINAV